MVRFIGITDVDTVGGSGGSIFKRRINENLAYTVILIVIILVQDNIKIAILKNRIGIKVKKDASKLEMKEVWKEVKDGVQV